MEKKEMKVSIIIPVYNTEKYIAKTLDSYEIIVVNDGSTDNSQEIMDCSMQKEKKNLKFS